MKRSDDAFVVHVGPDGEVSSELSRRQQRHVDRLKKSLSPKIAGNCANFLANGYAAENAQRAVVGMQKRPMVSIMCTYDVEEATA